MRMSIAFGASMLVAVILEFVDSSIGRQLWWHGGAALLGFIVFQLGFTLVSRNKANRDFIVLSYGSLVVALVLASGLYDIVNRDDSRTALFGMYPTVLAAAVVVGGISILSLNHRRLQPFFVLAVVFSLLFTGARVAILSFVICTLVLFWLQARTGAKRVVLGALPLLAAIGIIVAGSISLLHLDNTHTSRNLLEYSDALDHPRWFTDFKGALNLVKSSDTGPDQGGQVYNISINDTDADQGIGRILAQSTETSEPNTPYVASIFLRAGEPISIQVGTNLTSQVCQVSDTWSRCESQPGIVLPSDRPVRVQFRLTAADGELPVAATTLQVWGAQLEIGTKAGDPHHTSLTFLEFIRGHRVARRFTDLNLQHELEPRIRAANRAWSLFREHPVQGSGFGAFQESASRDNVPGIPRNLTHAHNLLLQIMAESGALGLVSWLIPLAGIAFLALTHGIYHILVILLAVLLLNTTDLSYYHAAVYAPLWLMLGAHLGMVKHIPNTATQCLEPLKNNMEA